MDKNQLDILKKKLEENKQSLEETLGRFAKKDTVPEGDWDTVYPKSERSSMEEMADEVEEFSSLIKVEHALEVKLKNIDDALAKMKDKKYGICEKCNSDIGYKKLSITPETRVCKSCQE